MCGIDVHMDPNIGKRLNALGNTLTSLTGEEDVDDITDLNSVNMADLSDEDENDTMSPTVHMVRHHPANFYIRVKVLIRMEAQVKILALALISLHIKTYCHSQQLLILVQHKHCKQERRL